MNRVKLDIDGVIVYDSGAVAPPGPTPPPLVPPPTPGPTPPPTPVPPPVIGQFGAEVNGAVKIDFESTQPGLFGYFDKSGGPGSFNLPIGKAIWFLATPSINFPSGFCRIAVADYSQNMSVFATLYPLDIGNNLVQVPLLKRLAPVGFLMDNGQGSLAPLPTNSRYLIKVVGSGPVSVFYSR